MELRMGILTFQLTLLMCFNFDIYFMLPVGRIIDIGLENTLQL